MKQFYFLLNIIIVVFSGQRAYMQNRGFVKKATQSFQYFNLKYPSQMN